MSFVTSFHIGQVVTNDQLVTEFQCGNMGGMRRSRTTNTLVIVSDQTKLLSDDRWSDDILHYTGMGKSGDQDLHFMQNRTLADSGQNLVDVHLFEVLIPGQYIYRGQVELANSPYQADQKGEDGQMRKVWVFPVHQKQGEIPISEETLQKNIDRKARQAKSLTYQQLERMALERQGKEISTRNVSSAVYLRDSFVSEYTKRIAKGICQLCKQRAPFDDKDGTPYLETHHIVWLSRGGADDISNTVALCPNCHRRMHVLDLEEDKRALNISAGKNRPYIG